MSRVLGAPVGTERPRSPSGSPLVASGSSSLQQGGEEHGVGALQPDPLADNGLGSPACETGASGAPANSCETSGFVAAAYPTSNFGLDVHIETGALGISQGGLMSVVQDLVVTPLWMALVWAAHAMVVMLEWGFTIDLLDSPAARGLGGGLRAMQEQFTDPLLPAVLAGASILAVYQGLVRRRVSHAVGEAMLMALMMSCGIWVISNPAGTIGALSKWANDASLGALAVGSHGTPQVESSGLTQDMQILFAATVEAPWCYLEFGQVSWCRSGAQIDPRLRVAGLRISAAELALAAKGGAGRAALTDGARLISAARTNGEVFLSLPANSPARNSITEASSLLRAICQSSEATTCTGPTAAQAEFRTNIGTWPRLGGLLLITIGMLGVLLLLGFVGIRLLTAATFSLLFLLLAPVVVLAPAFGERGRSVFRRWGMHLLGAVLSKLLFAFVLGVLLAVFAVIANLPAVGWWTQWLLMSAFAWAVFSRRHSALGIVGGAGLPGAHREARASVGRGVRSTLQVPRAVVRRGMATGRRVGANTQGNVDSNPLGAVIARGINRGEAAGEPTHDATSRRDHDALIRQISRRLTHKRVQAERIRRAEALALDASDGRRAATLADRADRVDGEVQREEGALLNARHYAENGRPLPQVPEVSQNLRQSVPSTPRGTRGVRTTGEGAAGVRVQRPHLGVHAADWPRGPGGDPAQAEVRMAGAADDGFATRRSDTSSHPDPAWWDAPEQQSRVMQDIREVEAGRKLRPGYDQK